MRHRLRRAAALGLGLILSPVILANAAETQRVLIPAEHEEAVMIPKPAHFQVQLTELSGPVFANRDGKTLYTWPFASMRNGITVLNSPGTIDADYRGEVGVILINHGKSAFTVTRGLRIAQMVIAPVRMIMWEEKADLTDTARGAGGFGSTGIAHKS